MTRDAAKKALTCPPPLLSQPATMRFTDSSSRGRYNVFLARVAAAPTRGSSSISKLPRAKFHKLSSEWGQTRG